MIRDAPHRRTPLDDALLGCVRTVEEEQLSLAGSEFTVQQQADMLGLRAAHGKEA